MNVLQLLQKKLGDALAGMVADVSPYAAMVKPTQDPRHGDYQANCAMALAKVLGRKPPEVAQEIVRKLDLAGVLEPPQVAGPGFINLRLREDWLSAQIQGMARGDRLGVAPVSRPKTFVIDFSSPNVAKPMHVGHLRSTILGDALARLLRFLGHKVIADNHLGDWGTQFGILLYGYKHFLDKEAFAADPVHELARLYLHVRSLFKKDDDEAARGRPRESQAVGALHAPLLRGDRRHLPAARRPLRLPPRRELLRPDAPRCGAQPGGEGRRAIEPGCGRDFLQGRRAAGADPQARRGLHVHDE
jgi:arginyl-tRNA synthetase